MSDRIPFDRLDRDDQDAIKAWLADHRVNPDRVPIDAQFDRDPATGEWRIPVYWHDGRGRAVVNPDGETIRQLVVRRRELRPLPWPRIRLRIVPGKFSVRLDGVDLTHYVSDVQIGGEGR